MLYDGDISLHQGSSLSVWRLAWVCFVSAEFSVFPTLLQRDDVGTIASRKVGLENVSFFIKPLQFHCHIVFALVLSLAMIQPQKELVLLFCQLIKSSSHWDD